ncbi:MAG TPA: hypothetical protein VMF08_07470 [Candidatus Sulfotelmatobacter sp.]|nr:hypothetical protein [Candidatus Sulfotelmatobacter sp.]
MTTLSQILQVLWVGVVFFLSSFQAGADSNAVMQIGKSQSPNHSLALFIVSGGTNSAEELVLMSPEAPLAELPLSKAFLCESPARG